MKFNKMKPLLLIPFEFFLDPYSKRHAILINKEMINEVYAIVLYFCYLCQQVTTSDWLYEWTIQSTDSGMLKHIS